MANIDDDHSSIGENDRANDDVHHRPENYSEPSISGRMSSPYDRTSNIIYRDRPSVDSYVPSRRTSDSLDILKNMAHVDSLYPTSTVGAEPIADQIVYTSGPAETERYLDQHGITFCKGPNVIRKTLIGQPVEFEQRVCLRYLKPPRLPSPEPNRIKQIEQPGPSQPPLIIREQQSATPTSGQPIILREQPPERPYIPPAEEKTVVVTGESGPRSIVIERFPPVQEKPRDIIIEKWLPYDPIPERKTIVQRITRSSNSRPSCTINTYENPTVSMVRKFAVIDITNADPDDYVARYRDTLLPASRLNEEARRVGVHEDLTSPSALSTASVVRRKNLDYYRSRDPFCDCFTSVRTKDTEAVASNTRLSYVEDYSSTAANKPIRRDYSTTEHITILNNCD